MGCGTSTPGAALPGAATLAEVEFDPADPTGRLGSGASCDVYRGHHLTSGQEYAIKVLDKFPTSSRRRAVLGEDLAGARTEAKLLRQLTFSDNVVRMYDFAETPRLVITMLELVSGGDLLTAMEQGFRELDVRRLFKQLLIALGACHSVGIAHRDVKPDNIMLTRPRTDATVKLVDFGFAKQSFTGIAGAGRCSSNLGSPMFKAPEVWDGAKRSAGYSGTKADVWSAGVVLFLMLSGQYPFRCQPRRRPGMSTKDYVRAQKRLLRDAVLTGSIHFSPAVWAEVSSEARVVVSTMLTVSASSRPAIDKCLELPWFSTSLEGRAALGVARRQLVGFNARRKLRAGFFAVHAAAGTLAALNHAAAAKGGKMSRHDTTGTADSAAASHRSSTAAAAVSPTPAELDVAASGTLAGGSDSRSSDRRASVTTTGDGAGTSTAGVLELLPAKVSD